MGAGVRKTDRTILHIDCNAFYASVECLRHPELKGLPVAVGGDAEKRHGIILAKNQPAKKCGVKTGEALWQARQKCPDLVILPPDYARYIRFSRLCREIYEDYSPQVESFGLDECWVDVSNTPKLDRLGPQKLAHEIRLRVKEQVGITVSVGVSYNKIFAKLGSDYQKPDAVTVFDRENMREKVWPLAASELLYVGRATERKLDTFGIHTIGELATTPVDYLQRWFGKWGLLLHCFANGMDSSPVAKVGEESIIKSIGNSTTTPRDLTCEADASVVYWMLCESVAARLRDTISGDIPVGVIAPADSNVYYIGDTAALESVSPVDGFTFSGWKLNGADVTEVTFGADNIEVTGEWTRNDYTITYEYTYENVKDADKLEAPAPVAKSYGDDLPEVAAATKDGYTVTDWVYYDANDNAITDGKMPAGNVTAKATQSGIPYTLTYTFTGDVPAGVTAPTDNGT